MGSDDDYDPALVWFCIIVLCTLIGLGLHYLFPL
jgi:hypothetical protein